MQNNKLSSAKFADKIGVPRSGLSHVLNGRNKVSLDYVLKILETFPQIDTHWLLTGTKSSLLTKSSDSDFEKEENGIHNSILNLNQRIATSKDDVLKEVLPNKKESKPKHSNVESNWDDSQIDRIVIFYTNGNFKSYQKR